MKEVIFKSEKKAKCYEVRSVKKQGVYSANELIYKVKTDDIESLMSSNQYKVYYVEI